MRCYAPAGGAGYNKSCAFRIYIYPLIGMRMLHATLWPYTGVSSIITCMSLQNFFAIQTSAIAHRPYALTIPSSSLRSRGDLAVSWQISLPVVTRPPPVSSQRAKWCTKVSTRSLLELDAATLKVRLDLFFFLIFSRRVFGQWAQHC